MKAYNEEYTLEQYKILKKIYKSNTMTADECRKKFGTKMFQRSFKILRDDAELILDVHDANNVYYEMTVKGINTYFILRENRFDWWKKFLISKWVDIIVAFVTAGITADHWQDIKMFFANLLSAFFK